MKPVHWTRLAFALWAILLSVAIARPLVKPNASTVYTIYANAGSEFAAGQPIYGWHAGSDVFRYSPLVAALFEPFSLMPLSVGGTLWRMFGAVLFLTGLAAWARHACPQVRLSGIFLLALPLSIGSFINGQANVHIVGLMLWAAVLTTRGWWGWAAALIAGAALFKGYPLAYGMLLALAAPLRHGVPLAAAIGVGLALPYLLQSHEYVNELYKAWFDALANDDRTMAPLFQGYQDFHMLLRLGGVNISHDEYVLVQVGVGAAAAGAIVSQLWKGVSRDQVAGNAFALSICWMATFGPGVESSTLILLAPFMAREILDREARPRWTWPLAATGGLLFLTTAILFAFPHQVHRPIIAMGIQPLAALFVAMAVVGRVLSSRLEEATVVPLNEPRRIAA